MSIYGRILEINDDYVIIRTNNICSIRTKEKILNVKFESPGYELFFGDVIFGELKDNHLTIRIVYPGEDQRTVRKNLGSVCKKIDILMEQLDSMSEGIFKDLSRFEIMTRCAWEYRQDYKSGLIWFVPNISIKQTIFIFNWWYENFILRKFVVLGLGPSDIEAIKYHYMDDKMPSVSDGAWVSYIYDLLTRNPYLFYMIGCKKCEHIARLCGISTDQEKYTKLLEWLYVKLTKESISLVPLSLVKKEIPECPRVIPISYPIIYLEDNIALKYSYEVENTIANVLLNGRKYKLKMPEIFDRI